MQIGTTQTLTNAMMDGKDVLKNNCTCGSEGANCCNDIDTDADGCTINRRKWYSSDPTVLTVEEGPNDTTLVTAIKHGSAVVTCQGYSHWYCDRNCGCNGCSSSSVNSSWSCLSSASWSSGSSSGVSCAQWISSTQYYPDGCEPSEPVPEWRDTVSLRIATWTINVYDPDEMPQYIYITGQARLPWGGTTTLTATTKSVTETYKWYSSDTSVATVGLLTGIVTAVKKGSVKISAQGQTSLASGSFDMQIVGVVDPRVTLRGLSSIEVGENITYVPKETCNKATTWSWALSSGSLVGADGTYTGASVGSGTVTATSDLSSQQSTFTTNVRAYGDQFISIGGPSSIGVGNSETYQATYRNFSASFTVWTSSSPLIASVGRYSGVVVGLAVGTCSLVAYANGVTEVFTITVTPPSEEKSMLQYLGQSAFELQTDTAISTEIMCKSNEDDVVPEYEWRSINRKVATVDESAIIETNTVHPVKEGTGGVDIRAHNFDAEKIVQPFLVYPKQGVFVSIESDSVIFDLTPVTFVATTINGTDASYTWSVLETDPVGQFRDGVFYPTREGTVTIKAVGNDTGASATAVIKIVFRESVFGDEHIGRSGTCPAASVAVGVVGMPSPNLFLSGKTILGVNEKCIFEAVLPCGDTVGEYFWGSTGDLVTLQEDYTKEDPEYYGSTGYIHALASGSTEIRVAEIVGDSIKTKTFSGIPVEIQEYFFCVTNAVSHMVIGDTINLNIAQGKNFPEASFTISSDSPTILGVTGMTVSALAAGTGTIRIVGATTLMEKTINIEVIDPSTENVPIISYRSVLIPGQTETFSCSIFNENPPGLSFGIWSTSNDLAATVSGNDNLCDVTPGDIGGFATITYENLFDPTMTRSVTIYVPSYNTPLCVSYQNKMVQPNTYTFSVQSLIPITETYVWASSNEWVATVDSSGVVTAGNAGTCSITVQGVTSNMRSVVSITVYDSYITITGWSNITEGESKQFLVSSYCTTEIYDWYSSDHCRATVSSTGVVTGHVCGSAVITAIGRSTKKSSSWNVRVEFVSQSYMREYLRGGTGSSSWVAVGSTSVPACWMSSSSSVFSSSWATWTSSSSCSEDSDTGDSSCSWSSKSSMYSSSWTIYYPYQYSSSLWTSSWSSSGVSSWRACDSYYIEESHNTQYISIYGPNMSRLGEYINFEVTGYNEGSVWYPCCGADEGDYAWATSGGLSVVQVSGESGKFSRTIGTTVSSASVSVTRGQHLLLHECFTKFNALRSMVISCAAMCADRSFVCQAKQLPAILTCDCKAEAEAKIDLYNTLMNTIKSNCLA
jgi:uncharacterized protein YjdB